MLIQIEPSIRVRFDGTCWTLEKLSVVGEIAGPRRGRKPKAENIGAERWDLLGYHASIDKAAVALLTRHAAILSDESATSLRDLIHTIQSESTKIQSVCRSLNVNKISRGESGE